MTTALTPEPASRKARAPLQLGLLGERVVAEVDCLGSGLGLVSAPRLTPQPLLRSEMDFSFKTLDSVPAALEFSDPASK